MAQSVTRRTREIGIRMAVGAHPNSIMRLVLKQTIILSAIGIVVGVLLSLAASRLIAAILYGVSPTDALSIIAAAALLLLTALLAGYLPARRAMRIDPIAALRHE